MIKIRVPHQWLDLVRRNLAVQLAGPPKITDDGGTMIVEAPASAAPPAHSPVSVP